MGIERNISEFASTRPRTQGHLNFFKFFISHATRTLRRYTNVVYVWGSRTSVVTRRGPVRLYGYTVYTRNVRQQNVIYN